MNIWSNVEENKTKIIFYCISGSKALDNLQYFFFNFKEI